MSDFRDLALADLADAEAALLARVAELEADLEIYRLLAKEAIELLRAQYLELKRLQAAHHRLLSELRRLRVSESAAA